MTSLRASHDLLDERVATDLPPDAGLTPRQRPAKRGSPHPARFPENSVQTGGHAETTRFQDLMDAAPIAAFAKDRDGRYVYANKHLLAALGKQVGSDWHGKTDADLWPRETAAALRAQDEAVLVRCETRTFLRVLPFEDGPHTVLLVEFPLPRGDPSAGVGGIGVDLTAFSQAGIDRAELVAVVNRTGDSVMAVDLDGRITDVNAAFERVTGYSRDEAIGQNAGLLKSGVHPAAFYEQMWATITGGEPWVGEFVDRRKDGSFFTVEAVISPIRDRAGRPSGYVAVNRDVTDKRALAEQSARSASEHTLVLDVVRDLRPDASPEATAQAICRKVAELSGIAAAQILVFELDGRALPLGHVVAEREDPPLSQLPYQMGRRLQARAANGPWVEPWANRQGREYDQLVENAGPSALAYAPLRYGERLIGLLAVQSVDVTNKGAVADLLPTIVEFADLAGALIGPAITVRIDAQSGRDHVSGIIAHGAFMPVFQPIMDILLGKVVGFEALTRFTDGSDPEAVFAEAAAVHLGIALETAALKAALAAADALPGSAWLNVNASPEFILAGEQLRYLISGSRRPIVVEVTEHEAIADYPALCAAMAALGPKVRFAVDDAGTGFTSLRHILELRPAFVKLDRWLVAGLESDEARQAMIVGLRYFSRKTGCKLIAEGIETDREIAVLRSLDIHLGQGYALGRPQAANASATLMAMSG
jgi:PAS domain S-box-containing protein